MRLKLNLKLFLLLFIFQLIFGVSTASAADYFVKPYIIVLSTWKNKTTEQDLTRYKSSINKALTEVQDWYKGALSGKTFKIDSNIVVDYPSKIPTLEKYGGMSQLIDDMYPDINNFTSPLKYEPGFIKITFVIGSSDISPTGGPNGKYGEGGNTTGRAHINHNSLEALETPTNSSIHNKALAYIAHELAHSFGAVWSVAAKSGHPCTVGHLDECTPEAPRPLPSDIEWTSSIVGLGGLELFPNVSFNNSVHNPEKYLLFKSPFLNPEKTNPPPPQAAAPKPGKITSISPQFE